MAKSKSVIIEEIQRYITNRGGDLREWYVGIAANPRERLFDDHSVNKQNGTWIFRTAESSTVAREIEQYFLERGARGGSGGGSINSMSVYAYRVTAQTRE
ncbi:MAG: hypothetical protein F4193_06940 [Candidatus Dadabacteria bacterium]|nr:hypothetical protein [Gammaproteobacteria bacterium]MYG83536.1 hypothetical protein [Candidatus Dadabacteria bacterium]